MKDVVKNILRPAIGQLGKFHPKVRQIKNNGCAIFTFHDVGETVGGFSKRHNLCTPQLLFRQQIDWINNNFEIVNPINLINGNPSKPGSAIITFDDSWNGIFEYALPILMEKNVPSILFLNMAMTEKGGLLISAIADYLGRNSPEFIAFAARNKLPEPYHLSLTPKHLSAFEQEFGTEWQNEVSAYQGLFAKLNQIKKWDRNPLVYFGNHLYNHWNACALTNEELVFQFKQNEITLKNFQNYLSVLAFPNGQPGSCFTDEHVNILSSQGVQRVLSTAGGINLSSDAFLLDRIALTPFHRSQALMCYAVSRRILLS